MQWHGICIEEKWLAQALAAACPGSRSAFDSVVPEAHSMSLGMTCMIGQNTMNNDYKRSLWLMAIRVMANVLTLAAICVAMYMSYQYPSESLVVFCKWFFGITVVTWVAARKLCTYIRYRFADLDEGLVQLPGRKDKLLMRWKIAAPAVVLARPAGGSLL